MDNPAVIMNQEEKIIFSLRSLYERYGYTQYRMSKFEEYDLYAQNKDFLVSDNVITFNDTNGRLLALKPDVTLSIVRSSRDGSGTQKVYYNENVYRVSGTTHTFKEIMQVGLECIGIVDDYALGEVLMLAAKSLREISADSLLTVSHIGIVADLLSSIGILPGDRPELLRCIEQKNFHEMEAVCKAAGITEEDIERLKKLAAVCGTPSEVLPRLRELGCTWKAVEQLEKLGNMLTACGLGDMLRIDFSIGGDLNYYNGIVFKGYVSSIPSAVLTGGQYDRLMRRMGRRSAAVGFAVYTDMLERLDLSSRSCDVDTVLLYGKDEDPARVAAAVEELASQGVSVSAQQQTPDKLRSRRIARLTESGVEYDG